MASRPLTWIDLDLSTPLDTDQVRATLLGIYAMSGSPFVTLEAQGSDHTVTWRLGCDYRDQSRLRDLVRAHLPHVQLPRLDGERDVVDRAARLRFKGSERSPLLISMPEATTRTILAALARAGRHESVTFQLTLGPRRRATALMDQLKPEHRQRLAKWREQRFTVDLRVGATAEQPERVRSLINSVIASARGIEAPGVRLSAVQTSAAGFTETTLPWLWRTTLTPTELISLTAWPIGTPPIPGVPSPHPRRLFPSAEIPARGLVLGSSLSEKPRQIAIKYDDASRHLHIIGPTGVGKSTLVAHLALSSASRGDGLVVVDPKGDLIREILERMPAHRHDDVVVLNPLDEAPVGIGSLKGDDPDRTADVLLGVFHSIYADNWGIRSSDVLRACLLSLARRDDTSLVMIPMLLTNPGFRRSITSQLGKDDPLGLGSFWGWYESLSEAERQQAIGPVLSKLRAVLLRPGMRHTLGQREPRFAMSDVFAKKRILLVDVSKRQGPESSVLLGSIVVSLLWDAISTRSATPSSSRNQIGVYIDEVQDYLRLDDIQSAIVQARGLGASLGLSHQHVGQLGVNLREAILANVGSRIMFGLQHKDATDLARTSRDQIEALDLESLPAYEAYASLLVDGTRAPWVSLRTQPLGPPTNNVDALLARSRESYGVAASQTEADLRGLIESPASGDERIGRTPRRPKGSS